MKKATDLVACSDTDIDGVLCVPARPATRWMIRNSIRYPRTGTYTIVRRNTTSEGRNDP